MLQQQPGVGDERLEPLGVGEVLLDHGVDVEPLAVVDLEQDLVLLPQHQLELLAQDARVEQILHADAHPGHLVAVGGADPATGRADPGRAQVPLDHPVKRPVMRHHQMRVGGDEQARHVHAPLGEPVDLGEQHLRVDDDAVAENDLRVRVQSPAGHEV